MINSHECPPNVPHEEKPITVPLEKQIVEIWSRIQKDYEINEENRKKIEEILALIEEEEKALQKEQEEREKEEKIKEKKEQERIEKEEEDIKDRIERIKKLIEKIDEEYMEYKRRLWEIMGIITSKGNSPEANGEGHRQ